MCRTRSKAMGESADGGNAPGLGFQEIAHTAWRLRQSVSGIAPTYAEARVRSPEERSCQSSVSPGSV